MQHPNQTIDYWRNHINGLIIEQYWQYLFGEVADFGCGRGFMSAILIEQSNVKKVVGYDIYDNFINPPKGVTFEVQDLRYIGRRKKFDGAISFHTLEHIESPLDAAKKMHYLLKKNSHLVVSIPFMDAYANKGHVNMFNVEQLQELMEKAGFETVECYHDQRVDGYETQHNCVTGLFKKG
jgi:2-polyprenyl-3-methyl-5-hydroxy-6-metoxy-1,4-benzoquinol methylase